MKRTAKAIAAGLFRAGLLRRGITVQDAQDAVSRLLAKHDALPEPTRQRAHARPADAESGSVAVTVLDDGEVMIATVAVDEETNRMQSTIVGFYPPPHGRSPKTTKALKELAHAIERDNEIDPLLTEEHCDDEHSGGKDHSGS